ncbi:MAG: hypothetical protein HDQ88_09785 [Clostridia bacterium]|nr:hypothetical protein [Clostridia bacterium]
MSQEITDDFIELARYYAQAEKELEIQYWVNISIQYTDNAGNVVKLFTYDLPREVYERREWVVEWRKAKLTCLYPKVGIQRFISYYDKRLGNNPNLTADLRKLTSAKAQVTKARKQIEKYVAYHKENNMFFDESTDSDLIAARQKLLVKISNVQEAEKRLKAKIVEIKQSPHFKKK